ncbi:hypothetical protein NIES2107_60980 [Nostoc carneum NIES-2107]|nr:hypothetical protein NIES2107_60980 [Nostoc carneum NIES-2107]
MNQDELLAKFGDDFKQLSNEPIIQLSISPLMAWQIISQLQLALRHPENSGASSKSTRHFVDTLASQMPMTDSLKELFNMGWNPDYDQPQTKKPTTEVHNAVAIYGVNEDGTLANTPIAEFARPQDWGDKERWHYEFFRLEWHTDKELFINNCHCWTDIKNPETGYAQLFAPGICMILIPGNKPQLCGRDYLDEDDFWSEEWGEMPPYYLGDDEDEEDIYL